MKRILLALIISTNCYGHTPIKYSFIRRILCLICPCIIKKDNATVRPNCINTYLRKPTPHYMRHIKSGWFYDQTTNGDRSPVIEFVPEDLGELTEKEMLMDTSKKIKRDNLEVPLDN